MILPVHLCLQSVAQITAFASTHEEQRPKSIHLHSMRVRPTASVIG